MVRELSLSWGHFPITSSLAEVRINLTIPVLSAGHLKALHDGLGETEALKEHFLPPSSPPGPVASSLLASSTQSRARLQHRPRTGGAGWGSPGCGRSSRSGSCPWPADPASRACWCSAACNPAASAGPAAAAASWPAEGHRDSSAQSSSLWVPQGCPDTPTRDPPPPGGFFPQDPRGSYQQLLVFGLEVAHVFLGEEQGRVRSSVWGVIV